MKDLLETLSNNKVQDILEEMGMLENGNCPYTVEEIFKAGVEYAQNHIEPNEVFIDKAYKWIHDNWREYIASDRDGVVRFGGWEHDFRDSMKGE